MDEFMNKIKASVKNIGKKVLISFLPVFLIIVFLAASVYYITVWADGKGDDDWSGTPYAAGQYTSNITVSNSGELNSSMTAKQLWDKMIENGSRVNLYLDKPEELLKLMNAEIITQFPDVREDVTKEIDWDSINNNIEENVLQGIIKFKRADSLGNEPYYMTYAEPYLFDAWLEDYNSTGDEDSKKNLLSHFTIRQETTTGTGESAGSSIVVTGKVADVTEAIVNQITKRSNYGLGKSQCQAWVGRAYQAAGFGYTASGCCAYLAGTKWGVSQDFSQIVSGAAVWTGAGSYRGTQCSKHTNGGCGHAGIYYKDESGNDWVMHLVNGAVKKDTLQHWLEYYGKGNTPVWGWQGGLTVVEEGETTPSTSTETDEETTSTAQPETAIQATTSNNYYVEVATWNETTNIVENKNTDEKKGKPDPDVEQYESTTYSISTTKVNYQEMVSDYTMPFDYLWSMLVITEDKDFVMDLADLVYESEIEITVHDNLTVNTNVNKYTYKKMKKTLTDAKVTATGKKRVNKTTKTFSKTKTGHWKNEDGINYLTTYTKIAKTNTLDVSVTYADVWMAKYTREYTTEVPDDINSQGGGPLEDIPYPDVSSPAATGSKDTYGHARDLLNQAKKELKEEYSVSSVSGSIDYVKERIYYSTINRNENITNNVKNNRYVAAPLRAEEKTDKKSEEPNFVTIFLDSDNKKAKNNILSVESWLFELLETNDSTRDLLDLTKYLLYKATGTDYGQTEWDFTVYAVSSFNAVTNIYGGSIQEKVWFALIDLGYSEIATAGAMGNIHYESGTFSPTMVERGYNDSNGGIGICQWTNNERGSSGRNDQLKDYAASKGVEWTDEDTQVEFLISELSGTGAASDYTDKQLLDRRSFYSNELACPNGWKNATTVEDATVAFCYSFERPSASAAAKSMSTRQHWANYYYEQFKGKTRGGIYNTSSESAAVKGYYTNSEGKKFTILNQTKISGWGSKCNRAASAIIASGYSNETPDQLISNMNSKYRGSLYGAIPNDAAYWSSYGLTVSSQSDTKNYNYMTSLKQQLISGGYALYWLNNDGKTYYGKSGTQWTSKYHWVAVIDYKEENGTGKICVADYRGITWVDIDEFKANGVRRMVYINEK